MQSARNRPIQSFPRRSWYSSRWARPRKQTSGRQNLATFLANALAVAVGIGTEFIFHFIGDLYLAEFLLVIAAVPLLMTRGRRLMRREFAMIYVLMGLWLLGLFIADAYNHIQIVDRMRGTALIVFFAIDLATLTILLGYNPKRQLLYLIGHTVGSFAFVRLQPNAATADYPWKFGYAQGVTLLVMLIASYYYNRRRYVVSAVLIFGICATNLLFNYRGPVLELLIALVLVHPIIPERMGRLQVLPSSRVVRTLVLVVLTVGAAGTARTLVHLVTQLGYLDEDSQAKNEAQSRSGNLLLGGRPEFAIGLRAALDAPIIGHGSWAKDPKYYEMLYDTLVETGEQDEQRGGDIISGGEPLIPAHSGIVNAWVWAGIFGLVFWIYIVWLVVKGILNIALLRPSFAPLYMWLVIAMFWDIFFSPFAASRRITDAFLLVVLTDLMQRRKGAELAQALKRPLRFTANRWRFGRHGGINPAASR
jgi:hypothetical protein